MNICARLQAQNELAQMLEISKKQADNIMRKMVIEVNVNHEKCAGLSI